MMVIEARAEFNLTELLKWLILTQKSRINIMHNKERGKHGTYDSRIRYEMYMMVYLMQSLQLVEQGKPMELPDAKNLGIDPEARKAAERKMKELMNNGQFNPTITK